MTYLSLDKEEILAQFDALQLKLRPLWANIGRSDPGGQRLEEDNTVVVVPSLTGADIDLDVATQEGYEERMLFMLFLLRQPRKRLIYLTSIPVPEEVVSYYLHLLPGVTLHNARQRLVMISPQDTSSNALANKLLDRPEMLSKIRSLIPDLERAHMVPFVTTDWERELAVRLGIPMYAADPRFFAFGTKSGCRRIFAEENVPHPLGLENLRSEQDLIEAVLELRRRKPSIKQVVVKHNEGVSGYGNARLRLEGLPTPGSTEERGALAERLKTMQFERHDIDYTWYINHLTQMGGIVEELISGEVIYSPSAQLRITPLGEVELLSTHDQILGGDSGQVYLGARFPANTTYGPLIMHEAAKVGQRFAKEGIVGRFALDFIVVRKASGEWDVYAIEINLRKGGTTHPFLTLQYLTDGTYNTESGIFQTPAGTAKYYIASDNLKSPAYRKCTPAELLDLVSDQRLHYDHITQTGVVLHMFGGVATHGRLGLTAIGNSAAHADEIYKRFVAALDARTGNT